MAVEKQFGYRSGPPELGIEIEEELRRLDEEARNAQIEVDLLDEKAEIRSSS